MDLHELLSTAVADLPDLPDQVPAAQRIHRRRTAMARVGAVTAATALVVGVGTLTIASPWSGRPSATTVSVAGARTPHASATPAAPASIKEFGPSERSAAPALSGVTLTGTALSTSYAGHVTVLDIWGSWCTPCRTEGPTLSQAYQKHRSEDVRFLGIDERDDNAAAQTLQADSGIGYPSLRDSDSALVQRLSRFVQADVVPSLVIVDPRGKVAVTILGVVTSTQLDEQIAYALATTSP